MRGRGHCRSFGPQKIDGKCSLASTTVLARLVPVLPLINTISRYSVQYVNADFNIRIRQNYHFEYFCESPSKKHSQEHSPRYSQEFDHDGREAPYLFWNGLRHDPNGLWQSKLSQV